ARNGKAASAMLQVLSGFKFNRRIVSSRPCRVVRDGGGSELPVGGGLHVGGVEAELDVALVAEDALVGELDADGARSLGVLAEERLVEQEGGDLLGRRLDAVAGYEGDGILG